MNTTAQEPNSPETDETGESIEAALVLIAQRIQSPDFAQKLRERLAQTDLDLEYRLHVKKYAEG